jgi:ATP-dependent protease HslVU (ClpYQ) peptidase subunit
VTVIAGKVESDRIVIGSDSQVTLGWNGKDLIDDGKLMVLPDLIVGGAGASSHNNYMAIYLENHKPRSSEKRDVMEFFVEFHQWIDKMLKDFKPRNSWLIAYDGRLISVQSADLNVNHHESWAIGSGWEYARTALHLGHPVEAALQTACDLTVYCAPPIVVRELLLVTRPAKPTGRGNRRSATTSD